MSKRHNKCTSHSKAQLILQSCTSLHWLQRRIIGCDTENTTTHRGGKNRGCIRSNTKYTSLESVSVSLTWPLYKRSEVVLIYVWSTSVTESKAWSSSRQNFGGEIGSKRYMIKSYYVILHFFKNLILKKSWMIFITFRLPYLTTKQNFKNKNGFIKFSAPQYQMVVISHLFMSLNALFCVYILTSN